MVNTRSTPSVIFFAGLLTGTLDILAAVIQTYLYGGKPEKMLQYIASGLFGERSFTGGLTFAFYGLLIHYAIAFAWTILFFLVYRKLSFLKRNWLLSGVVYGAFIWAVMNLIVLPLSHVPHSPARLESAAIGMLILMACVGLPLAYFAGRFFSRKE